MWGTLFFEHRAAFEDGFDHLLQRFAQRSGATTCDGQQHLLMLPVNPPATALYEVVTSTVNDVGHLQRRSVHALRDTPAT